MVADNDLALGRIVTAISKSSVWASSLILVVEDDAQDGLDHVDGHRTVALADRPFHPARRGVRFELLHAFEHGAHPSRTCSASPARTRYLAAARGMNSVFSPERDTTPYPVRDPRRSRSIR